MGSQGHYQLEDGLYDKPKSRKKTYLYSALVLLLLIAAGVGIGVVVSRLSSDVRVFLVHAFRCFVLVGLAF